MKEGRFAYLISETETGYVDGWYMNENIAADALANLRETYHWLHYGCHCIFKEHIRTLGDDEMLNRHYDDPRRKQPHADKPKCTVTKIKEE